MSTTRTQQTIAKKVAPFGLREGLKREEVTKRNVHVVAFHDETRKLLAFNVEAEGGTVSVYYLYTYADATFARLDVKEGAELEVKPGAAIVVLGRFQGLECIPTVYVRSQDVADFFEVTLPDDHKSLPPELAADWMDDHADACPAAIRKHWRAVSPLIRKMGHAAYAGQGD